ncbi:MAG: hypothetical protein HY335_03730, partial [Deinococcus sp.]|nr:hypothetical protein [Deinococcus sp.]
ALRYFLLTLDLRRPRFFLGTLLHTALTGVTLQKLTCALSYMVVHKHFHEYVTRVHGDPETAGARSPFARQPTAPPLSSTVAPRTTG